MIFMDVLGSSFFDFMRESIYIQCLWLSDSKQRRNIPTVKFSIYWAKDNRHTVYSLDNMFEGTNKGTEEKNTCNTHFQVICSKRHYFFERYLESHHPPLCHQM